MLTSRHVLRLEDAARSLDVPDASIHLVVTSPPYPMIEMWDESFVDQDPGIGDALTKGDGETAFRAMHELLDPAWRECERVLHPGGFLCVNIGDATRSLGETFRLYANHAALLERLTGLGFVSLPAIIWRKPTNAPTKFMGSGTLPAGAYVTLEHEYILVMRKGGRRRFSEDERSRRRRSAMFWEERNQWYSDVWELRGTRQALADMEARKRSAAFPFELPYRLINMFSVQEDWVLDPFAGTGTTMAAAAASGRNTIGIERSSALEPAVSDTMERAAGLGRERATERLEAHARFVEEYRRERGHTFKHWNDAHRTPVMSGQETDLTIPTVRELRKIDAGVWEASQVPARREAQGERFSPSGDVSWGEV
jgi:DNA modification methylase